MNFFDFATLAKKKGSTFFSGTNDLYSSFNIDDHDSSQVSKNSTFNENQNTKKAFELIKALNEELDQAINESIQHNDQLDKINEEFSELNESLEVLFGKIVTDIDEQMN